MLRHNVEKPEPRKGSGFSIERIIGVATKVVAFLVSLLQLLEKIQQLFV